MIRLLGALLVVGSCFMLGEDQASGLRRRVRALEALEDGFGQMEREISLRLLPLPQLMEDLADHSRKPASGLFQDCRRVLDQPDETGFDQHWRDALAGVKELKPEDRRLLEPLGQVLGRYDGQEQVRAIRSCRRELELALERAREESRRMGRVYRAVSAAGGGFLVILLL